MKKLNVFPLCLGCVLAAGSTQAIDLKQSKVTQVVNDVQIISAADQKQKAATINDIFSMPDILRTGASSRAELIAQDETVTRVGANTIFSFDPANRSIDLKQGSLLFHSPHGKGGGTIHTGSATASVLGTTLIVVTTPNGGLKVIALEGEVEVKFLNGLKQKLDPGQMTFVLPGANQLAPVIIFRLDELTSQSFLVKGFNQNLRSLPLIQSQIDKQLKLIQSGKMSDTGLLAGDSAGPDKVEVLDPNTLLQNSQKNKQAPQPQDDQQPPPSPPPLQANLDDAEAADAIINAPSLLDAGIPTPPIHLFLGTTFPIPAGYFGGQEFSGFIAKNIFVNTPALAANPLIVDLSPYQHRLDTFAFVSLGLFEFDGSTTFKGLAADDNLSLIAGDRFVFAPGISIRADVKNLRLASSASLVFDNVGLYNSVKDINLNSADAISFLNNSTISAGGRLIASTANDITAADSHIIGNNSVLFTSLNGNISVQNSIIDAPSHAIFLAPGSINFDNSTVNADFVTINSIAAGGVSINNTAMNSANTIGVFSINDVNVTGDSGEETVAPSALETPSGSTLNTDPETGTVSLTSLSGSVKVTGTSITAHYLTLNSGDGILLDGSGHSFTASGPGSTANFTAPNLIAVNNADLTGYQVVNMAANTINLFNVSFSGAVSLKSLLGYWYNGYQPGAVNDLGGVYYNNELVDVANFTTGVLGDTGITVGTLSGGGGGGVPSAVNASAWGGNSRPTPALNVNLTKGN